MCLLSGLQPFFCRVRPADLVHYDEGIESSAECWQVPGVFPDRRSEPCRAEAQEQAATAQQVRDEPGCCMVAFEFGQGPAFGQRVVDERQCCHRLQPHHTHCEQAQQTMPRGEVGFTIQVFVVNDGCQTQDCTGNTEALQDPVSTTFCLVWKLLGEGAVGGEQEYGFCHEEGKLVGEGKQINGAAISQNVIVDSNVGL